MKKRLDMLMMERALAPSREKAKAYIMAGDVYVDGQKEDKAGTMFPETVKIEVRGNTLPYVSRGGLKLEKAMKNFDVTLDGKVCMDVGASTGGFTDCMLQNGADVHCVFWIFRFDLREEMEYDRYTRCRRDCRWCRFVYRCLPWSIAKAVRSGSR